MIRASLIVLLAACGSSHAPHAHDPVGSVAPPRSPYLASADASALANAERAWSQARACLVASVLGDGADVRDAIAVQQPKLPDCSAQIAGLGWPHASGAAAAVSQDLDDATRNLAALAVPWPAESQRVGDEAATRAAAIRDVDDARTAAGFPAIVATPLREIVPLAGPPELARAGVAGPDDPVEFRRGFSFVDHVARIDFGEHGSIFARGPHAITAVERASHLVLSRDAAWGVQTNDDGTISVVGAFDGHALVAPVPVATGGRVLGLAGSGATRVLLVRHDDRDEVELSHDGGKTWRATGKLPPGGDVSSTAANAIDVVSRHGHDATWIRIAADGTVAAPRPVPELNPGSSETCLAGVGWWGVGSELRWDDGARAGTMPLAGPVQLVTCADTAVVAKAGGQLFRCTPTGCGAGTPIVGRDDPWLPIDLIPNGFVYAIQLGRVVELQRTGTHARFARLASGEQLVGVVVWSDVPYLVTRSSRGARIATVP